MKVNAGLILLSVVLVFTAMSTILQVLNALNIVSFVENCDCYPGITEWGYLANFFFFLLVLNIFILPVYFSMILSGSGILLFICGEFFVYFFAIFAFIISQLSTPTPDLFDGVYFSIIPVASLLLLGWVLWILPRSFELRGNALRGISSF